ncbi:MAG: TlpA disulfide reductase family protein [Candidatus Hydrogenedentota bacterium]
MNRPNILRIGTVAALVLCWSVASAYAENGPTRERNPNDPTQNAKKDALEGKAPPALGNLTGWMNTVDGKPLAWADLKGKVILIDFWGTWCPPCRRAIPHLKELSEKHADDGLIVLGIHTKNAEEEGPAYVREQKMEYPIAFDSKDNVISSFHVDGFPDYYLIDHKGILRFADVANGDADRAVEILLEERKKDQ